MTDGSVCLSYVHSNEVAHSWHQSVLDLYAWDLGHHGHIVRGGYLAMRCGTGGLVEARNQVAQQFLEGDAEWLFVVDSDMGFTPDTLDRLLDAADPVHRPIVGALCFAQRETQRDGMSGFRCAPRVTILDLVDTGQGKRFAGRAEWPPGAVVQCAATGMACIVIHRSVLERLRREHGPRWFDRIPGPDGLLGEDVSFCVRAGAAEIPVFVHTGVRTTHLKQLWLSEQDFWTALQVPPATETTAVLVPVLRRPQNAEPFMASLTASTGLAVAYAIAEPDDTDTIAAWRAAGAEVLLGNDEWPAGADSGPVARSFAEKVNLGYRQVGGLYPWLFLTGDDVRFHPGWLDHAQHIARTQGAAVIGTNDLANPRVMAGEHGTHLLISRAYVDEQGASWDGPGVVTHEGYRHWYVDDEIVTVAKQHGVWAAALGSRVEHLHPIVGKAPMDDVYRKGQHQAKRDQKTFEERCEKYVRVATS